MISSALSSSPLPETQSAFASADHLAGYAGLAPAPRDSRPAAPATCTDPGVTTGNCNACSTPRPRSAFSTVRHRRTITTANVPKVNATGTPSSGSPDAASTSSGPCCASKALTKKQRPTSLQRLDKEIENQEVTGISVEVRPASPRVGRCPIKLEGPR